MVTPNLGLVLTPDGNTHWGDDQRNNLSTIDTFAGTVLAGTVPVPVGSQRYYVDGSRTDSYSAIGDVNRPFKTIMAAVNQIVANGDGLSRSYLIIIAPGTYSETINLGNALIGHISFSSLMPDDSQISTVTINGPGGNGVCLSGTTNTAQVEAVFFGINFFNAVTPNGNILTDSSGNGTFNCTFTRCYLNGGATGAFTFNNVQVTMFQSNWNTNMVFNGANAYLNMLGGKAFGGSLTLSVSGCYVILEQGTTWDVPSVTIPNGVEFYLYSGARIQPGNAIIVQSGGLFVGRNSVHRGTLTVQIGGTATLDDCWVADYSGPITSNGLLATASIAVGGSNPASQGAIRLSNASGMWFRNGSNTGDVLAISVDSGNNIYLGSGGNPTGQLAIAANGAVVLSWDTANQASFVGSSINLVSLLNNTQATASNSQASLTLRFVGSYWNGSGPAQDIWTIQNVLGAGTNDFSRLTFAHTGSGGPAQCLFPNGSAINQPGIAINDGYSGLSYIGNSLTLYSNSGILVINDGNSAVTFSSASVNFGGKALYTQSYIAAQNPTAATSSVSQSSPNFTLAGQYWNGTASANDQWTIQDVVGSGTNGASQLLFTHNGSSGAALLATAEMIAAGALLLSTGYECYVNPNLTRTGVNGRFVSLGNNVGGGIRGWCASADFRYVWTGVPADPGADAANGGGVDTGITRVAPATIAIGNGGAGDASGTLQCANVNASANLAMINSVAATASVPQFSPQMLLQGQYWNGSASAPDKWTIQDVVGSGTNGTSNLVFSHSGTSGVAVVQVPKLLVDTSGGSPSNPCLQIASIDRGLFTPGGGMVGMVLSAVEVYRWSTSAFISRSDMAHAWSTGTGGVAAVDTGISRLNIGTLGIGNGTQGDISGSLQCAGLTLSSSLQCASATITCSASGALYVGQSGSFAGKIVFGNATSGTISLTVPTGALGNYILTLPNTGGTIANLNSTQTFTGLISFAASTGFSGSKANQGQGILTAASAAISNTETVVVACTYLQTANRLIAGSHIRCTWIGTCTSTGANTSTFNVRWGNTKSVSDSVCAQAVTAASATTGTNVPFRALMEITFYTVGTTITAAGTLTLFNQGPGGISNNVPVQVIPVTITSFDSTHGFGFTLTYVSAGATTSCTFTQASIDLDFN